MTDNTFLAKPPGDCCTKGTLHEGEHRGTIETVASIETYIVHPPEGKANGNIVLYFPDVWGFFKNGFLTMDAFADAGYLTIGLDYFRGDPVWLHRKDRLDHDMDPEFDFQAYIDKHMAFAVDATPKWVEAVKEKFGKPDTKFAVVGCDMVLRELSKSWDSFQPPFCLPLLRLMEQILLRCTPCV